MEKTKMSTGSFVAIILLSVIPFLLLILGIFALLVNVAITKLSLIFEFIICPLLIIILIFFFNRKRVSFLSIFASIICMIVIFVIAFYLFVLFGYSTVDYYDGNDLLHPYIENTGSNAFMPKLEDFEGADDVEYCSFYSVFGIFFDSYSHMLKLSYDSSAYEDECLRIDEKYQFFSDNPSEHFTDNTNETSIFEVADYSFQMLKPTAYTNDYPHDIIFIGRNDATSQIIYIWFIDYDLDYIYDFEDFIYKDCGFKYFK